MKREDEESQVTHLYCCCKVVHKAHATHAKLLKIRAWVIGLVSNGLKPCNTCKNWRARLDPSSYPSSKIRDGGVSLLNASVCK